MRSLCWLVLLVGCSGQSSTTDDLPPDPKGWTITVDMSALERYVTPETATAWRVSGTATATEGLGSIGTRWW